MGLRIGDVYLRLLAEAAEFQADVKKEAQAAGDQASTTLGQAIKAGFKSEAPRVLGATATAAFAVMTKGALEMGDAQARIQSETNATAEEAKRMAQTANTVAGDVVGDFNDIRDATIGIRNDLGAVGDEADQLTQDFGEFGRVTRQDAAGAVADFDDILDAWNLKAGDSRTIMDALIASKKEYGGVVAEDQKALADLAPVLQAVNMDWRDGIAVLNLAKSSGLDTGVAMQGLMKALKEVKSPEEFKALLADISATEDPLLRSQKAAELFGRSGAKLGDALAGADLDDFRQEAEETTGALEAANDALNSSPAEWFRRKISQAGAALRGFGSDFGPALTGMAALGSLASTVFGPGFLVKIAGAIGATSVVSTISSSLGGAIMRAVVPSSIVGAAATGAGTTIGGLVAAAIPLGIVAAAGVGIALAFKAIFLDPGLQEQTRDIGAALGEQLVTGTREQLEQSKAALEKGIADIKALPLGDILYGDQIRDLEIQHAAVVARLEDQGAQLPEAIATGVQHDRGSVPAALGTAIAGPAKDVMRTMIVGAGRAGGEMSEAIGDGVLRRQARVRDAFDQLKSLMQNVMTKMEEAAYLGGVISSRRLERALQDGRPAVRAQGLAVLDDWEQRMTGLIKSGGKGGKEAQRELRQALKSEIPEVRAAAERVKNAAVGEFEKVPPAAGREGRQAGSEFVREMRNAITGRTITISAGVQVSLGQISGARAAGGPVRANEPYIVGENGWELYVPDQDGQIVNQNQLGRLEMTAAAAQAGGDTIINMPVQGALPVRTPRDVVTELRRIGELGILPPRELSPKYHRREAALG